MVNHKRVYRLYSAAKLAVKKCKKAKRPGGRTDTASDRNSSQRGGEYGLRQRQLGTLRTAHQMPDSGRDFSHECVEIAADFGISGQYLTRLLDQAATFRGYTKAVRTDNGPEFTSRAFMGWAKLITILSLLFADEFDRTPRLLLNRSIAALLRWSSVRA